MNLFVSVNSRDAPIWSAPIHIGRYSHYRFWSAFSKRPIKTDQHCRIICEKNLRAAVCCGRRRVQTPRILHAIRCRAAKYLTDSLAQRKARCLPSTPLLNLCAVHTGADFPRSAKGRLAPCSDRFGVVTCEYLIYPRHWTEQTAEKFLIMDDIKLMINVEKYREYAKLQRHGAQRHQERAQRRLAVYTSADFSAPVIQRFRSVITHTADFCPARTVLPRWLDCLWY